ncbi:hypothetical protein FB451DRAFT_1167356 [Mycena latifolia]|nr:hypothetical protein FB451DRAFT_1167356 [Mycena latifolia]
MPKLKERTKKKGKEDGERRERGRKKEIYNGLHSTEKKLDENMEKIPTEIITEFIRLSTLNDRPSLYDKAYETVMLINQYWRSIAISDRWLAGIIYVDERSTYHKTELKISRALKTATEVVLHLRFQPYTSRSRLPLSTLKEAETETFIHEICIKLEPIMHKCYSINAGTFGNTETETLMNVMQRWNIPNLKILDIQANSDDWFLTDQEYRTYDLFQNTSIHINDLTMESSFHLKFDGPYYADLTHLTLRYFHENHLAPPIDGILDVLQGTTVLTDLVLLCVDFDMDSAQKNRVVMLPLLQKLQIEMWDEGGTAGTLVEALKMPALHTFIISTDEDPLLITFSDNCRTAFKNITELIAVISLESHEGLLSVLEITPNLKTLNMKWSESAYKSHHKYDSYRKERILHDIEATDALLNIARSHKDGNILCPALSHIILNKRTFDNTELEELKRAAEKGCFSPNLQVESTEE